MTLVMNVVEFAHDSPGGNAAGFYEKNGSRAVGTLFTEVGLPHLRMEKRTGG